MHVLMGGMYVCRIQNSPVTSVIPSTATAWCSAAADGDVLRAQAQHLLDLEHVARAY